MLHLLTSANATSRCFAAVRSFGRFLIDADVGPYVALIRGAPVSIVLGCNNPPVSATGPRIFMGVDFSGPMAVALLGGFLILNSSRKSFARTGAGSR